ncbi:hypothetical protein GCM10023169_14180 [Georgenia halophila]|uniref:Transcriptional regulator n=1 Tax=Georgenia halophila TaxID=620889 RepID=A0ABP8L3D9_9MICO
MPRRHRRVVRLSDADRKRLAEGEITDPVEALHDPDATQSREEDKERPSGGNDDQLRRDVPPHWGKH